MYISSFAISLCSLLVLQLADTNGKRTLDCIQAIKPRLGPPANPALEYRVLEERMRIGRFEAVERLAKFGEDAAPAVPILSELIFDRRESEQFKLLAIKAIGSIGPVTPSSLPTLKKILDSPDLELRQEAQRAIDRIESFPKLLEHLSAQELATQLIAAKALSEFGSAAFSGLARAYLNESSKIELRKELLDAMVGAVDRFDFGPHEVESLLGDLNDSRYRLGVDILFHLVSNAESRDRGKNILNHSKSFDGPTLVRSLLYGDRVIDGKQIGVNLIEMLESDCREIACAVASDIPRFELADRTQAAQIAAKADWSTLATTSTGQQSSRRPNCDRLPL